MSTAGLTACKKSPSAGGDGKVAPAVQVVASPAAETPAPVPVEAKPVAEAATPALVEAPASATGWTADFAAALKEAEAAKKDLLMDFTGSDWCTYCIRLHEEVFATETFKAAVKDKFVLVEVDFPQDGSKLSEATKKQNEELKEKYPFDGFPTVFLCDAQGRPYAVTGYEEGGAEPYVKNLEALSARKKARDEALLEAEKREGVEKAKSLVAALALMDLPQALQSKFYSDVVEKIKAADPQDTTGFAKKQQAREKAAKFQEELQVFGENEDVEGALALVDKTIAAGGLEEEDAQKITLTKAMIYADQGRFDEALKVVEDARKIAPTSEISKQLDGFKQELETAKKDAAAPEKPAGD